MKKLKELLIIGLTPIIFVGCDAKFDPTPKRVIPQYNQETAMNVAKTFDTLYRKHYFEHANSLMCEPNTENKIYNITKNIWFNTKDKPISLTVKGDMYSKENFKYMNIYSSYEINMEEQILPIKQHFYFNYAKYYKYLTKEEKKKERKYERYIIDTKTNKQKEVISIETKFKNGEKYTNIYELKKKDNKWCVLDF